MAIHGVSREPIGYVPEDQRTEKEDQSVIWIRPKTGHAANQTMARYAAAGRDGRKGYRDLSVNKLDAADIQEFLAIVVKVENYIFSDAYPELAKAGLHRVIEEEELLKKVAVDIPADLLIEIMEAANNMSMLKSGEKKSFSSRRTSASGKAKSGAD